MEKISSVLFQIKFSKTTYNCVQSHVYLSAHVLWVNNWDTSEGSLNTGLQAAMCERAMMGFWPQHHSPWPSCALESEWHAVFVLLNTRRKKNNIFFSMRRMGKMTHFYCFGCSRLDALLLHLWLTLCCYHWSHTDLKDSPKTLKSHPFFSVSHLDTVEFYLRTAALIINTVLCSFHDKTIDPRGIN